jgi:diamine N-acetyltransferase
VAFLEGGTRIRLIEAREVNAHNWREVVRIEPREDQRRFVASVAYYLNLCHYGGVWKPLALYHDGEPVGFAMWGYDAEDDSHWIGGFVIDGQHQGKGYGRAALETMLDHLATQPGYREAALSYEPENTVARRLYASLGFVETGEHVEDELVARRPADDSTTRR